MRSRLEDLGRLLVKLEIIYNDLDRLRDPENMASCRDKDFVDQFYVLPEDDQHEILRSFAYKLTDIKAEVGEAIEIAKGEDYLNAEVSRDLEW